MYDVFVKSSKRSAISLSWAENLNKLYIVMSGKSKFSAQEGDLAHFFWYRDK